RGRRRTGRYKGTRPGRHSRPRDRRGGGSRAASRRYQPAARPGPVQHSGSFHVVHARVRVPRHRPGRRRRSCDLPPAARAQPRSPRARGRVPRLPPSRPACGARGRVRKARLQRRVRPVHPPWTGLDQACRHAGRGVRSEERTMLSTFTNVAAATGMNALMIAAAIFALILTVLWILVPFAVFGIKSLLRQLIAEQRRTNDLLATPPVAPAATTVRTDVPGEPVYVRRAVP